tara:strand:+ start:580 stop:915 length:336 start_codon:yes stop_codon:yes gene_type:complete
MSFNRTVLTVATVIFIILLTVTAIMIKSNYKNDLFPPEIPKCPDFWEAQDGGGCKWKSKNPDTSVADLNPTTNLFLSGDSLLKRKEKCTWAKENNVMWDGIWDGVKGIKGC